MPKTTSASLRAFRPLFLVLAVVLLWSAWWLALFLFVRHEVFTQRLQLADQGVTLACAGEEWGGYPFRISYRCRHPQFSAMPSGREILLSGGDFRALLEAYNPLRLILIFSGPVQILDSQQQLPELVDFEALVVAPRWGDVLSASASTPKIVVSGWGEANSLAAVLTLETSGDLSVTLSTAAARLAVGSGKTLDLDHADTRFAVPAVLLSAPDPLAAAMDQRVPIAIEALDLAKGNLSASANGPLSLDARGLLNGRLNVKVNDLDALYALIVETFPMTEDGRAQMRSLFNLFKASGTSVDLVARAGRVLWGVFPIGEIPPLASL